MRMEFVDVFGQEIIIHEDFSISYDVTTGRSYGDRVEEVVFRRKNMGGYAPAPSNTAGSDEDEEDIVTGETYGELPTKAKLEAMRTDLHLQGRFKEFEIIED